MTTTEPARPVSLHDLPGLWRRTLLVGTDGRENTSADVRWIQSGDLYVDLRIPGEEDADSSIAASKNIEGFAGTLVFDGTESFEWQRDIDLGPPVDPPDAGTLHFVESVLVETGIHENYVEHWVATLDSAKPQAAARLRGDTGERAIVVRAGSYFGWAQSVPGVGVEIAMGSRRGDSWTITGSSVHARVGADFDLDALGAGTGRSLEIATDYRRRWTITFSEGEFS